MKQMQTSFKRYEIKYLITQEQRENLMGVINEHMTADEYGKSTICNIYYDTPDKQLIRQSLEKPIYKEKLRVRSYGPARQDGIVFVELKKKFEGVVYKRRVCMSDSEASKFLSGKGDIGRKEQIIAEINYFKSFYRSIMPSMYISYDREAFHEREDKGVRLTLDDNILWRDTDLSLTVPPGGSPVLDEGVCLLEVKTHTSIPLWLSRELNALRIYQTSFSKYGTAYLNSKKCSERRIICA